MSQNQAPAEVLEAARAFLSRFAGVDVDPATASYMEHEGQRVLEFTLPEDGEKAEVAKKALRASLGFKPDRHLDHHGEQLAWDIERDRKRVFMNCRFDGEPEIGFCHWD